VAIELVLKNWCDVCLLAGENTPGETLSVPSLFNASAFDVELCEAHAQPLRDALTAVAPVGRAPGKTGRPGPVSASKGAPRGSYAPRDTRPNQQPGTGDACPECGNGYNTRAALRTHLRDGHGKSLADVGMEPARFTCDECGGKFGTGQGIASHVRLIHGGTWGGGAKRTA
jgi:hypothetical protein